MRYVWLQDQVKAEALGLEKVAGADNPADLATKHLNAETMWKHMVRLGARTGGGRASSAPVLGVLSSKRRGRRGGESQRLSTLRRSDPMHHPAGRNRGEAQLQGISEVGVEYLERLCETEELKKQIRKNCGKLRELAAKFAKNC